MNLTGATAHAARLANLLAQLMLKHHYVRATPDTLDDLLVAADLAATGTEMPTRNKTLLDAAQTPWNPNAFVGYSAEAVKLIRVGFRHALEQIAAAAHTAEPEPPTSQWLLSIPVLSTGHITKGTSDWLMEGQLAAPLAQCASFDRGFYLSVPHDSDAIDKSDAPADLAIVWRWAMKNGYPWVRLDADGDEIEQLPTYDW